jgi:6,7-dimethyl-8-ribityllumazine synthase
MTTEEAVKAKWNDKVVKNAQKQFKEAMKEVKDDMKDSQKEFKAFIEEL